MYSNRAVTATAVRTLSCQPSVAIVMPFEPKMTPKGELELRQKTILRKIERELMARYPAETGLPVIRKVQQALRELNYSTHKRSVALFVTADGADTLYMDITVDEKIVVDAPFTVKDLPDCKVEDHAYLVLLLGARQSRMYLSVTGGLKIIKSNTPQNVYAWLNEVPERSANFSDPSGRREVMLDKFLHHMDEGLAAVLAAYPRPVFVIGDSRTCGHFAAITRHGKNIAGYVHRNASDLREQEILEALRPTIADWDEIRQQYALRLIEQAVDAGRLATGIAEVLRQAKCSNSRLLIVEKGYNGTDCIARPPGDFLAPAPAAASSDDFFLTDPVDGIIFRVLANGGDVLWVDKGRLKDYGQIALIRYY